MSEAAVAVDAVRSGDRRALAKMITLLESSRPDRAAAGRALLEELMPHTGGAARRRAAPNLMQKTPLVMRKTQLPRRR